MEFAHENGRSNELIDVGVRKNIGATTMRINEVDEGLFDIPRNVCLWIFVEIFQRSYLTIVPGTVLSIDKTTDSGVVVRFRGSNGNVQRALAQSVVIAIGAPGKCNIPKIIQSRVPEELYTHTSDFVRLGELKRSDTIREERVSSLVEDSLPFKRNCVFKKESCSCYASFIEDRCSGDTLIFHWSGSIDEKWVVNFSNFSAKRWKIVLSSSRMQEEVELFLGGIENSFVKVMSSTSRQTSRMWNL